MEKICDLIRKYWDVLSYLFFGFATTVLNYLIYFPCIYFLGLPASVSNVIAWVISATFAFVTNKAFVFRSRDWSCKSIISEGVKFFGCRVGSGVLESVIILLAVDIMKLNSVGWKIFTSILVVVLNYFGSKFLVFKDDKSAS